jgi:hypothetical protein
MFAIVGGRRVHDPHRQVACHFLTYLQILVCSPPDSKEGTKFEVLQLILDDEVVNERKVSCHSTSRKCLAKVG